VSATSPERAAGTAPVDAAPGRPGLPPGRSARIWYGYGRLVVALRWVIVVAWVAGAVASAVLLPPLGANSDDLQALGAGDESLEAEATSAEIFGFPLLSRVAMVQHNPDGMSELTQAEAVLRGIALNQGAYETEILGAIPVPNTAGAFPGSTAADTTVITYLFTDPRGSFFQQNDAAEDFAQEEMVDPADDFVGITGSVPARVAQTRITEAWVHVVEAATLLAILVVVAVTFRSLAAPILTLVSVGAAVIVTLGVAGSLAELLGVSVPADLRPLIVALLLGVVTDYCIFYLSGLRTRLAEGHTRLEAARLATATTTPIVTVAGVTVAAGTASLVVAHSGLFRGLGPGLAITVVLGVVVAITLIPALLAIFGARAFWPRGAAAAVASDAPRARPSWTTRVLTRRGSAVLVALACIAVLVTAALPLRQIGLGLGFVQSLPAGNPVAEAAEAAEAGFAAGIVSPTELLLTGEALDTKAEELGTLGDTLQAEPGVAGVVGPGDARIADDRGALVAADGSAARYLVVMDSSPLDSTAIGHLNAIEERLPALIEQAGLGDVEINIAGDTALAGNIVEDTTDDLLRIALAALIANLLMLVLFLRAFVAPLYLLASSLLALAATLGATVYVFQDLLGHDDLTFYVPFAAAVLLLSLGSDYNIFAVGRVWQLAKERSLRDALAVGVPQSTRAITSAGLALAASFGLLALVPLRPFRELGFALAVGILIDVFLVRALLVPSLLTIVGPVSGWPSKRLRDYARTTAAHGEEDALAAREPARLVRPASP
jgi:RND superfamily putative drug exporter